MIKIDYSLMFVTDDSISDDSLFFKILEAALKGGATMIQLREKHRDTRSFYHRALQSKKCCQNYHVPLIINDRLDIALAVNADGVHIGQKDMPYKSVRKLLGPDKIIGLSVSNTQQAIQANNLDVNYIGLSPIFATTTKKEGLEPPIGIKGLKEIRQLCSKPIISIGGLHKENALEVVNNGSNGIAVISAISRTENPEKATRELKKIIC